MAKRVRINLQFTVNEAASYEMLIKAIRMFERGLTEQTDHGIKTIIEEVDQKIIRAFAKGNEIDSDDDNSDETEFTSQQKQIIANIVKNQLEPLENFIDDAAILVFFVWAYNIGGDSFLKALGVPLEFDLRSPGKIAALGGKTQLLIQGLDATTHDFIAGKISEGIESGFTADEIADSIRSVIPETYKSRAETIARTGMAQMINTGQFEAAARNGAMRKAWITQGADDECGDNEDEGMIGMDEAFLSGDLVPPAHPNCRCFLDYDVLDMGYYWDGG
ncbi:MAG: hypothetical protein HY460_01015 [Parcubacteria group bacterium]|nr:hypothetical protein [Parcubacteria group bacterium]